MNIVVVPFHDWRKILIEGFRTRDAHFIEKLKKQAITLIINRPTTLFEIVLKRKRNLIQGEIIYKRNNFRLYKVSNNLYVIDYVSYDFFGQIFNGYTWFIEQYSNPKYIDFINECLIKLKINQDYYLLNQNIFAYKLTRKLSPLKSVFDAWDNFTKFKVYTKILNKIEQGYKTYSSHCDFWITNSKDNIIHFSKQFNPKEIFLIKNGVDVSRFSENLDRKTPKDMRDIQKPIVGFGGKITHLIDVDLVNETMQKSPNASFVFVGQILDRDIYNGILKLDNFHYLGDKHYDIYPDYVKNFDVCIVPYITDEEKKSGANTIKVYEYLATNKKVIGTNSNGLEDLKENVYVVNNSQEFSNELMDTKNYKKHIKLENHSWESKTQELIRCFQNK